MAVASADQPVEARILHSLVTPGGKMIKPWMGADVHLSCGGRVGCRECGLERDGVLAVDMKITFQLAER